MKIRVLLVEDQKIMQKYFASMVQGDERFLLVDVLNDGEKAVSYCNHTVVDLVLMDVQTFQNHDGLLAAETIKKQHPAVKVIVITSLVDPEILARAKERGADSLWYKDHGQEEIMEVIDRTLEGKHVFPDKAPAVELKWMKSDEISPPAAGDAETVYQRLFLFGDWKTDELFGSRGSMEFSGYDSESRLLL